MPKYVIAAIIMILSTEMQAQSKIDFNWQQPVALPATDGQPSKGFAGPITGVHNEVVFIGGGANFPDAMPWQGGKKKYYNSLFIYTKDATGKLKHIATQQLPANLAYSACVSTPVGVLCAGGENENGISNKCFLLKWDGQKTITEPLPDLPLPLTNASATIRKSKVYIAGGESTHATSAMLMVLDLKNSKAGWKLLPPMPQHASHFVMALHCNGRQDCIYIIGGRKKTPSGISDLYKSVFEYNIKKQIWTEKAPLPFTLCAGTGVAFGKKRIVVFGGDDGSTFHRVETMIAAINAEKDESMKQQLIAEKNQVQSTHPGFNKNILVYHIRKNIWQVAGQMQSPTPVTTIAVKFDDLVIIPSGEIRAGVRSPEILTVKIEKQ